MNASTRTLFGLTLLALVLLAGGCGRDNLTNRAVAPSDPVVFGDGYGNAVDYQAFMGSKFDAVQVDYSDGYQSSASLRITVPGPGATDGTFAGGAFTTYAVRDLSSYNALTFYVKSSVNATLNVAGLANDNTGTSLYESSVDAIPMTTDWTRVVLPIPNALRLTAEGGLFYYAEGYEGSSGYDFWIDELRYEFVESITNPRPVMDTKTRNSFVGSSVEVSGTYVTFDVGREDVVVNCLPPCFDYSSSDESVATVMNGVIDAVGSGTATITGDLNGTEVEGVVTVNVAPGPDGPADTPTVPSVDVISLFSDAYSDVTVDTWHAPWSTSGGVSDIEVFGDNVKLYTDLTGAYAGIEFTSQTIDAEASGMTHLHMDVWAPSGGLFKVKLVDFGPNGVYDGGFDDSEHELLFNGGTVPPFFSGQWSPLEIPLSDFAGLFSKAHLAQMVISSSDVATVIVDNVYFHR